MDEHSMRQMPAAGGIRGRRSRARAEKLELIAFFGPMTRRLLTTALLFGLFMEWLLPLAQLSEYTELYRIGPVAAAIGGFLAVGLFMPPVAISFAANALVVVLSVSLIYASHAGSPAAALLRIANAVQSDALLLAQGSLAFSGETRTLLLVSGLGMMAAAIQSLVWLRQWGLGLTGITLVYLMLLHSFLGFDVLAAVVRTLAEGLLLHGLLLAPRLERLMGAPTPVRGDDSGEVLGWSARWWLGACGMTVLLLAAGGAAAFGRPSENVAAPWARETIAWGQTHLTEEAIAVAIRDRSLEAFLTSPKGGANGSTGYGFDDGELGAPIRTKQEALFMVRAEEAVYLRGESKSRYDGRGWLAEPDRLETRSVGQSYAEGEAVSALVGDRMGTMASGAADAGSAAADAVEIAVRALRPEPGWPLMSAGPSSIVTAMALDGTGDEAGTYRFDPESGALFPAGVAAIASYTVESRVPKEDPRLLREAQIGADDPEAIRRVYTALPATLPKRIAELADYAATGGGGVRYDTVKAIESFLKSTYAYTRRETDVPPAGADFVDDFLFNQKQGYCVHFATAMTVLLRAEGIPARYVKGFAPGQPASAEAQTPAEAAGLGAEGRLYIVRASDAHAWVEVYFGGVGWVAFDPTPGITAAGIEAAAVARAEASAAALRGPDAAAGEAAAAQGASRVAGIAARAEQWGAAVADAARGVTREAGTLAREAAGAAAARPWAAAGLAAGAIAAAIAAAAAWRGRERAAFAGALRRYGSALGAGRHLAARGHFLALADRLWRELGERCGPRPSTGTAREYAAALRLPPEAAGLLAEFVRLDEQARYAADWTRLPAADELGRLVVAIQAIGRQ
ncbi:transglutaminase-like domain-containing protein [Paenibacillus methanolicus]|uniref:Transglutaminase-like putative cysteine protease n=1 Tax=Paenibacillus methanolicus TaxID=582686 RepID=A0A5S5BTS9_9BACL|nr:transglutaminase-like domain-containing protein [Paenibacillus methanolicus]TYP70585.1 transglutaminase-like putative cysteine protease [Paenibacillus methanolicus]